MKLIHKLLFLVLLSLLSVSLCGQEREQNNARNNYFSFLKEEGFSPQTDKDGDIQFEKDSQFYYLLVYDETPPLYIQIQNPGVNLSGSEFNNYEIILKAMNTVNLKQRLTKLVIEEGILYCRIELLIQNANSFRYLFYRSMQYLNDSSEAFKVEYERLKETKPAIEEKDNLAKRIVI